MPKGIAYITNDALELPEGQPPSTPTVAMP